MNQVICNAFCVSSLVTISYIQGCVSVGGTVLSFTGVYFMQLEGFTIDCTRSTAINITDGSFTYLLTIFSVTLTHFLLSFSL